MSRSSLLLSGALAAFLAAAAGAQTTTPAKPRPAAVPAPPAKSAPAGAYHDQPGPDIIVTGIIQRDRHDVLSGVSVLQGAALTTSLRPTIGETLERTPGVSSTSFGPNASRPVLRGLQGERVRVLTDGIGSVDVSNTSVDHAVVVDPLLAERIEVLRGPEALLYGSSAIGGVVNVIDKRIPRAVPDEPVHVDLIGTYGTAANERSGGGTIDVPIGPHLVLHADGSYVKTGDLDIGGHVLSKTARATALANAGSEDEDQIADGIDFSSSAALKGKLPNSQGKTWVAGAGAAYITDKGSFGLSYSHYDSLYGVPVRYATAPGEEQEAPRLDLLQNRIDARAEVQTGGDLLKTIRFRYAYANYRHFELEEDGSIGTAFYNKGVEGRLELVQADHGAWKGATGAQFFSRDFDVVGEEAFLPKNQTEQVGLFTLQTLDFGKFKADLAARYEHSDVKALPTGDQPQFFGGERIFQSYSGSVGASYAIVGEWRLGVNLSHTERSPSAEELFANGPHAGTEAFEIGDPDFRKEIANGAEALLRGRGPGYTFEGSIYYTRFSHYIFDDRTGELRDGLPVYQSRQGDARYAGFEAQGTLTLAKFGENRVVADALGDYTRATIKGFGPAPRIPPLRLLGGLGLNTPKIDVRGEAEWVDRQDRISNNETTTPGYTLVNASATIRPWGGDRPLSFVVSANNLFDVDARRHASFLKDFAPLAGRDIRITARASF